MKTTKKANPALEAAVATGKSVKSGKTASNSNIKDAKAEKPLKKKTSTNKEVAETITAAAVAQSRDVKYIYPENIRKDKAASKKFRAGIRRKVASFESSLEKLKSSKLPEDLELYANKFQEFEKYKAEVYTDYTPKAFEAPVKKTKTTKAKTTKKVAAEA